MRVLVVDDSAVVRQTLRNELGAHADIEVVGAAPDPFVARDMILALAPEVIVLDLEMPRMDGLSFLRRIMAMHPMPVIVCSSLSPRGSEMALACLEAGALEVFCKPNAAYSVGDLGADLARAVRAARHARPMRIQPHKAERAKHSLSSLGEASNKVILIGCSTGGPVALHTIFEELPANMPAMVIVQHMPPGFTKSLAKRLDGLSAMTVKEAEHGELLTPGKALVAPGGQHLRLASSGAQLLVELVSGPPVQQHKPSVEVLFESGARVLGRNAMGAVLTGMGNDGARGLASLRAKGALTVAQDEASSVVFGMPREAIAAGGVAEVLPLDSMATRMVQFARVAERRAA